MKQRVLVLLLAIGVYGLNGQSLQIVEKDTDTLAVGNAYTTADISSYINITNTSANPIDVLVKRIDKNWSNFLDSNAICWEICFETHVSVSPPIYALTINPGDTTGKNDFVGHVYPDKDGIPAIGDITYVFFDMNNPNDSAAHTVTYEVTATFDVPELNQRERLSVYPNPASERITLDYDLIGVSSASFELVNVVGNKVYQRKLPSQIGTVELNLSKLSRGVYFYVLRSGQESLVTKKLVVQ